MATRLHFSATTAPSISPAFQSYSHSTTTRRVAALTDASALANVAVAPDGADHLVAGDAAVVQLVYGPLNKQTFSSGAAFKYAIQALEAHANNNLQVQIWMGIVDGAGTARAAIRSKVAEGNEVNTALRNVFYSGTLDNTVNAEDGDYLVIEFSLTGTPTGAGGVQGHNGTLRLGGNGAGGDLPENDTETGTTFNPWIEFATDITPLTGFRRYVTTQVIAASATVGTTYTITCTDPDTGDTFTPVAVMAHYSGRAATGVAEATTNWGHGFATGAAARRCSVARSVHAGASSATSVGNRTDALIAELDSSAFTGLVDVDAFLGDGFRLIVDDQLAGDLLVVLEAWGGDIRASINTITPPGSPGNQDVNAGLDLTGGLDDKVVVFIGTGASAGANARVTGSFRPDIGVAAGDTVSQWTIGLGASNGSSTMNTARYMRSGECVASLNGASTIGLRASLTTWLSTGFRINWAETSNAWDFYALTIKGQKWQAGTDLTRTDTSTEKISTLYQPKFLLVASHLTSESASDTTQDHDKSSLGVAASASSRASISHLDTDALADSDIAIGLHTDRLLNNFDESNADKSTIIGVLDLSAFNTNGFTIVMDDADASANFFGWLIGGDTDSAGGDVDLDGVCTSVSVVTGTISVTRPLTAVDASAAALTAALAVTRPIVAADASVSALTGVLGRVAVLTGAVASVSTLSATLTVSVGLGGAVASISDSASALTTTRPLAAVDASASTVSGALAVARPLEATDASVSGSASDLTVEEGGEARDLDGVATSVSGSASALSVARPIASTVASVSSLTGSVVVSRGLAGSIDATSSVAGSVEVARPLTGSLAAVSTGAGSIVVDRPLTGVVTAVSALSGDLLATIGVAGEVASTSTATAALSVVRAIAGTAVSDSALTGAIQADRGVDGTTVSASVGSGALIVARALTGAAVSVSDASGVLGVTVPLTGSLAAISTVSGNIELGQELSGTAASVSALAADLAVTRDLTGTLASVSTASGALIVARELAGAVAADSTVTGVVEVARALTGAVTATSAVTGNLTTDADLTGLAASASDASGALSAARALTATADSTSAVSGELGAALGVTGALASVSALSGSAQVARGLTATAASVSALTGELAIGVPLAGAISSVSALAVSLEVARPLTGALAAVSTVSAGLSTERPETGAAVCTSTASGSLAVARALTSTAASVSSLTGELFVSPQNAFDGTVSAASALAGALRVSRALTGTATSTSVATGALVMGAGMAGQCAAVSAATGALTVARALAGTAASVSTVSGRLRVVGEEPLVGIGGSLDIEPDPDGELVLVGVDGELSWGGGAGEWTAEPTIGGALFTSRPGGSMRVRP